MQSSTILAGACLLACMVFTIAECTLTLDITKRQEETPCENSNDHTALGICARADIASDIDTLCDNNCTEVFEDYAECVGLDYDAELDRLRGKCGGTGVGAALLSTISTVVVVLAANLN